MLPLTYSQIQKLVAPPGTFDDAHALAYDDDGDPYQHGLGFIGPDGRALASGASDERQRRAAQSAAASVVDGIRRSFVAQDVLRECTGRRADGVASAPYRHRCEPARPIADGEEPNEQEAALIEEAQALHAWAEGQDVQGALHRALRAATAFGACYLRPYVPPARLSERENGERYLDETDPAKALAHVRCEVLLPDRAAVVTDPETGRAFSVVLIPETDRLDGTKVAARAEVSWVDESGMTRFAVVGKAGTLDPENAAVIDLRGRPMLVEVRDHARMITPAAVQTQRALNTALTEMRIVHDDAGFPVRILLGAMPPGYFERDEETGADRFVPTGFDVGPGAIVNVQGEAVYGDDVDADQQPIPTGKTRPAVAQWAAASGEGYAKEADGHRRRLLQHFKQLHVEITGDAVASGVSRRQARQDFLQDAQRLKAIADRAVSHLMEIALDYAAHLAGQGGRYRPIRCLVDCRLSVPEPTPQERAVTLQLLKDGVWTEARTMAFNGVDEPQREANEIAQERAQAEERARERRAANVPGRLGGFSGNDPDTL